MNNLGSMHAMFISHYAYWFCFLLMGIGLYAIMFKNNLVKKTIGLSIFQVSIIIFYVSFASKWNATIPILSSSLDVGKAENYLNPLPHTLMLTAIVVGVATTGVASALLLKIYVNYKTLNATDILKMMKQQNLGGGEQ